MKFFSNHFPIALVLALITLAGTCAASPSAMYFDPVVVHDVFGINRYPTDAKDWNFHLRLSPFYQHASTSKNKNGVKVPLDDRLGTWYLAGTIFGGTTNGTGTFTADPSMDLPSPNSKTYWKVPSADPTTWIKTNCNYPTFFDLNQESNNRLFNEDPKEIAFEPDEQEGSYSVLAGYEKAGVRGVIDLSMAGGFGLAIKGGVCDLSHSPREFKANPTPTTSDDDKSYEWWLKNVLMQPVIRRRLIEEEFKLSLARYQTTAFEDTNAKVYWSNPFKISDKKNELAITLSPYLSVGAWIPTGKKDNQDLAFSLPTGNNGFWGVSLEGALNFDFADTVLINVGGGVTFFETKTLAGQRVPSHPAPTSFPPSTKIPDYYPNQRALFLWKAKIEKQVGPTWNVNISLRAKDFIQDLSAFFDYVYEKHEHDSITIKSTTSEIPNVSLFQPQYMEALSQWKAQTVHVGLNYQVTPNIELGISGQAHIYGLKVYRDYTILGTISFIF